VALERLFGLYLGLCYVTVAVVCYHVWKRKGIVHAALLFVFPLGIWWLWSESGRLAEVERLYVAVAVLPLLTLPVLGPFAWLSSVLDHERVGSAADSEETFVARVRQRSGRWLPWALGIAGAAGACWFAYGVARLRDACGLRVFGSAREVSSEPESAVLCLSFAVAPWPLFIIVVWLVTAAFWRAGRTAAI
jgi:hypothetical protein